MTAPIGPGDWVICIDAKMRPINTVRPKVTEGRVYQVVEVGFCSTGEPGLLIDGAPPAAPNGFYRLDRFRPAGKGGMFNDLLTAKPVRVGEDA